MIYRQCMSVKQKQFVCALLGQPSFCCLKPLSEMGCTLSVQTSTQSSWFRKTAASKKYVGLNFNYSALKE